MTESPKRPELPNSAALQETPEPPKRLKPCIGGGESLLQDPIYGYIPFSSPLPGEPAGAEVTEKDLIDHPFVQRLRRIHQLQTAWLVYPTAEHTRFTHVLGTMHTASIAWAQLKTSFRSACREFPAEEQPPSDDCIEALLRVAALLHDVGHGPFGHFFDEYFLRGYQDSDGEPLTHERLGAVIIKEIMAPLIRGLRRTPNGSLRDGETVDPEQAAFLIVRPKSGEHSGRPRWLILLRTLFSGIYTVDNMDFVLRDAWLSGLSPRAFDRDRLLRYSFFTPRGLAIHSDGLSTLTRFLTIRAELFRSVYFHRTVRAADIQLTKLFKQCADLIFPYGNPCEHLDEYLRLTEWSLQEDVTRWAKARDPRKRALAPAWADFFGRRIRWRRIAERTVSHRSGERANLFNTPNIIKMVILQRLRDFGMDTGVNGDGNTGADTGTNTGTDTDADIDANIEVDIVQHTNRPVDGYEMGNGNILYDPEEKTEKRLSEEDIYRDIPQSYKIARVYAAEGISPEIAAAIRRIVCDLVDGSPADDATNM